MRLFLLILLLISSPLQAKTSRAFGSGFFIDNHGTFITNNHVVNGEGKGCIRVNVIVQFNRTDDLQKSSKEATVIARDEKSDLAILSINQANTPFLPLSTHLVHGMATGMFGYPLTPIFAYNGVFTFGYVSALVGMSGHKEYFTVSNPTQMGNSGGAVIDTYGNLVGIIFAKADALTMANEIGDLPQNLNFAIKTETLIEYLTENKIGFSKKLKTQKLDTEQLAKAGAAAAVLVNCEFQKEDKKDN